VLVTRRVSIPDNVTVRAICHIVDRTNRSNSGPSDCWRGRRPLVPTNDYPTSKGNRSARTGDFQSRGIASEPNDKVRRAHRESDATSHPPLPHRSSVVLPSGGASFPGVTGPTRERRPASACRPAVGTGIGTWSAWPQSGSANSAADAAQIVHTRSAERRPVVQLANAFGSQPLAISDVHVARWTSGSTVDTATDRPPRLADRRVTITAGG